MLTIYIVVASVLALAILLNRADAWMSSLARYRARLLDRIRKATNWSMPLLLIAAVLLVCGLMVEYGLARASMETMEMGSLSIYLAAILTAASFIAGVWWDYPLGARTVGTRRAHRLGAGALLVVCMATMASLAYYRAEQTAAVIVADDPVAPVVSDPFAGDTGPVETAPVETAPLPEVAVEADANIWFVRVISVGIAVILNALLFLFGRLAAPILQMAGSVLLTVAMTVLWLPWRIRSMFSANRPKGNPFTAVREFLTDPTPVSTPAAQPSTIVLDEGSAGSAPVRSADGERAPGAPV